MRRLFLLLLAMLGAGALAPAAPARAATQHHAAMPGGCHDEGQAAMHVCVGCAVAPDIAAMPEPIAPVSPRPATAVLPTLADRRPGFDPPPPRAA